MACLVSRFLTAEICKHSLEILPVHWHSPAGSDVSHLLETKWLPVPRPS
jgi:hypothetical protein